MLVRLVVGRVDDELIDGLGACRLGLAHRSTPPSATLSSRTRPRFMGTAVRDLLFAPAVWRVLLVRTRPRFMGTAARELLFGGAKSSAKSLHVGFRRSMSQIFFSRRQPLISFSRAMASRMSANRSK